MFLCLVKTGSPRRIGVDHRQEVLANPRRRAPSIRKRENLRALQKVAHQAGKQERRLGFVINIWSRTRKESKPKEIPTIDLKINVTYLSIFFCYMKTDWVSENLEPAE